jgi:hypothetical protein
MSDRRRAGAYEAALDLGKVSTEAIEILEEIDHAAALLEEILGRAGGSWRSSPGFAR